MGADGTGFGAPAAATATALLQRAGCGECCAAGIARHAGRRRACKVARVMVGRFSAAGFCARRPGSIDRATRLPGTANLIMSDARGRSMASPAVLIRAD